MKRVCITAAAAMFCFLPVGAHAQTATSLVERGREAYRRLEYGQATVLLRQALTVTAGDALPDSIRADTYIYLGASELYRDRRDSALAAFRHALLADPRHRPDGLVFPPEVTGAFENLRRQSMYVRIVASRDTVITPGKESYRTRLYASAPHDVIVALRVEDGPSIGYLYVGPIGDSLDVLWAGLDSAGQQPVAGHLMMEVTSRSGASRRVARLPLNVAMMHDDTIAYPRAPPDSQRVSVRPAGWRPLGALATALLTGAAAVALPAAVSRDGAGSPMRFAVAGALGAAGIIGFAVKAPWRTVTKTVATDDATRDRWRREVDKARTENERRRLEVRLHVTSGSALALERGEP